MMQCKSGTIPLKFLVTMILAIVIFGPTLLMINRCFRLSDEADRSYDELLELIERIAEKEAGEFDSARLYMDDGTAVVFMSPGVEYTTLSAGWAEGGAAQAGTIVELLRGFNARLLFKRPAGCRRDKSCVFLCRNIKVSTSGSNSWRTALTIGVGGYTVALPTDVYVRCEDIAGIKNVDYGFTGRCESPKKGAYYTGCSGGIIFERGIVLIRPRLRWVEVRNMGNNIVSVEIPYGE